MVHTAEFTKGEWKLVQASSGALTVASGNKNIAVTSEAKTVADAIEVLANAQLIVAAPECYEQLIEADRVICELCKRLNPQHATMDDGQGCEWCHDREPRLNAIAKAKGV